MLGFPALFLGDYRVLAKVDNEPFQPGRRPGQERRRRKGRSTRATSTRPRASGRPSTTRASRWSSTPADRGKWPKFLQLINAHLPDPVRDYKLDPNKPSDQPKLDRLRVHIDAIKPVWRNDVAADWFNCRAPRRLQEPDAPARPRHAAQRRGLDRPDRRPPLQPNPDRRGAEAARRAQQTAFGPYQYLTKKILPSLLDPALRVDGVHHVALAWMTVDRTWTTEKGANNNGLTSTPVPLLARATPPVSRRRQQGAAGSAGGDASADVEPAMHRTGRWPGIRHARHGRHGHDNPGMGMMPNDPNRAQARHADPHRLPDPVRLAAPEAGGAAQARGAQGQGRRGHQADEGRPEEQHRSRHPQGSGHRNGVARPLAARWKRPDQGRGAPAEAAPPAGGPGRAQRRGPSRRRPRPSERRAASGPSRAPPTARTESPPCLGTSDVPTESLTRRRVQSNPRATATMDQLKDILKQAIKYRFWIAVGISALLADHRLLRRLRPHQGRRRRPRPPRSRAPMTDVKKYTSGVVPNAQYKPIVAEKTDELVKDVNASWKKLYARQAPLLTWPESVEERFRTWERKWPENVDASAVQLAIIEYVTAYPKFVTEVYQTFKPFDLVEGTGLVSAPAEDVLLHPFPFTIENPPELGKVWAAQERLWTQRTLLDVVAEVNKDAKDWDTATIKQINLLEVGNGIAQDQKSIAKGEALNEAPAIANPTAPASAPPTTSTTGPSGRARPTSDRAPIRSTTSRTPAPSSRSSRSSCRS